MNVYNQYDFILVFLLTYENKYLPAFQIKIDDVNVTTNVTAGTQHSTKPHLKKCFVELERLSAEPITAKGVQRYENISGKQYLFLKYIFGKNHEHVLSDDLHYGQSTLTDFILKQLSKW